MKENEIFLSQNENMVDPNIIHKINDPIKILKANSSLILNGFSDYIEQIHMKKRNLEVLEDIENFSISKEYLCKFKLFLIATRTKRNKTKESEIMSIIQAKK